jgi:hypothetical protein
MNMQIVFESFMTIMAEVCYEEECSNIWLNSMKCDRSE